MEQSLQKETENQKQIKSKTPQSAEGKEQVVVRSLLYAKHQARMDKGTPSMNTTQEKA